MEDEQRQINGIPLNTEEVIDNDEIDDIRKEFLQTNRSPKVLLKALHKTRALIYLSTQRDDFNGEVHIHTLPEHHEAIQKWLDKLNEVNNEDT